MKWVLVVVGALIGLVVLMALIGALLPRDHVATSTVTLHQPPDSVWRTIRDLGGVPSWWSDMRETRRSADSAGREVWEQKMKGGFEMRGIVTEDVPPTHFVVTIDAAPGATFGGAWTYEVTAAGEGSRVSLTERGWVANPVFRFLSKFVFGHYGTLDSYLTALGKRFGEVVRPTHQ